MAIPTNKPIKSVTYNGTSIPLAPPLQEKSVTENGTVTPDEGFYGLSEVEVNVPTGTARTSEDLTVSGATVNVPAGLYSSAAGKSVTSGTAGTPTATKGAVSNHAVTVTPSVTNTTGYITGGTKTGTGVSVSASELVSGNKALSSSASDQTSIDVTNYSTVSISKIASGSAGTPTATKGAVSNHAVTVTPSVTNTTGYITGGTKTGTGVSVSASELVSGTLEVNSSTEEQTGIDVTNYQSLIVHAVAAGAKVDFGTFSGASSTAGLSVNHNLGVKPQVIIVFYMGITGPMYPSSGSGIVYAISQDTAGRAFTKSTNCHMTYKITHDGGQSFATAIDSGDATIDDVPAEAGINGAPCVATTTSFKVGSTLGTSNVLITGQPYGYIAIAGLS